MTYPIVSMIVATDLNGVIATGSNEHRGLPWRLATDLRRFQRLTMGNPVIIGRRTIEAIGGPLPGRCNIVLTRNLSWRMPDVMAANSPIEAIGMAREAAWCYRCSNVFVAGGAQVYREMWLHCSRLYLTVVHTGLPEDGAVYLGLTASINDGWELVGKETALASNEDEHASTYHVYQNPARAGRQALRASSST